jgi:O-antigen/teichoic acid export membrane protein
LQRGLDTFLDAAAFLVSKAAFIGLRLVALYLLARRVGRAEFGLLSLAFTVAEICRTASDWGTDVVSLREFSHPELERASTQYRLVVKLRLVSTILAAVLAGSAIHFFVGLPTPSVTLLVTLTAVTGLWLNFAVNWLQARAALRPASLGLVILGAISLAVQLFASAEHWPLAGQLTALLGFEIVMALMVNLVALRSVAPRGRPIALGPSLRIWMNDATPIAVAWLLSLAYSRFDQFYIKIYAPEATLGDYSLAIRLVDPFLFVAAAVSSTIYARASLAFLGQGSRRQMRTLVERWIGRFLAYGGSVFLVVGCGSQFMLRRTFQVYKETHVFIWVVLATLVVRCLTLCLSAFIQAMGAYRLILWISLADFIIIPAFVCTTGALWGPVGAALGVTVGESVNAALQGLTLRWLLRLEGDALPEDGS